ncbi:MAG: tyrosine-type recombinase/integrase [Anaerolineae bacterium]|nr:tyrosine-type recombinase/integrase [Anaerolineae bacterium]
MTKTVETLSEALDLFATVGMPARNLSDNTRIAYQHDLDELYSFLSRQGITRLDQVTLPHLEAFQAELDQHNLKGSTRKRKAAAIKSFFKWLHHQEFIMNNVGERLIPPKPEQIEPRFLSEEEYQALLRACSHRSRDAAIIELLLQTGMRLAELAKLRLGDIELPKKITKDPDNMGSIRVRRKRNKEVTIPLNYKTCQALKTWLKVRPEVDHDGLFVTKFKTAIKPRAIQYLVEKYMQEAGIEGASVHTMRHTFGTHHAAKGTDLKVIQETLGHNNLATTSIYVSLAKKAQRQALQENAL